MKFPKLKAIIRVQAYFCVIGSIVLGAKLGLAYKTTEQTFKELGGQLGDYLSLSVDGVEAVSINGERFAFAVTMTDQPVDEVLAATEKACAENSGSIAKELGPLIEHAKKEKPALGKIDPSKLTSLRRDSKSGAESGDVTCFTRPKDDGSDAEHPGFVERLERFTETLALGELGEAHYLRADYEEKADRTRILYVRSLSELKMSNLFGGEGDVPGRDPHGLPRPPSSLRTFSAAIERTGDGFYSYESTEAPAAILHYYEAKLAKDWEKIDLGTETPELTLARAFAQDDRAAYVVTEPRAGGSSDVALIVIGSRGEATKTVKP
jgi:hypothetical protein